MEAPPPEVRLAVDDEIRRRVELVAEVEADRPDRRLVPQAWADRVPQIAQVEAEGIGPDVPRVEEQHAAEVAANHRPQLFAPAEHAVAADRQAVAERAHLVPPPPADARRAAEEVALRERDVGLCAAVRPDVPELQPARDDEPFANRKVVPAVGRHRVVVERPWHDAPGLLEVKGDLNAAAGGEQ